jgi:Ca2+-binding RTX toxin-like protein
LLGGSGADTLVFVSYENQYKLQGTIYDNGIAQIGVTTFSGYDSYDGGNGTVKGGTTEIDTLKIVISVQQSNDVTFMAALNAEINYFNNVWLPAHVNQSTGQADQSIYEFKSINLKISAIEKLSPVVIDLSTNHAPVNTVPSGVQLTDEDVSKAIPGVSVSDPDGGTLTTTVSVLHGTLNVSSSPLVTGNGTNSVTIVGSAADINLILSGLTYTGNGDFNGSDTLTITTGDGLATDTDLLAITVNAVADIADDTASGDEDTAITTTVLANDSFEGTPAVTAVTQGANGTVVVNLDNTVTYTPNADFNGTDSYTYTVSSGGVTETATVNVTVNAVNAAPVAVNDKLVISNGTTAVISAAVLLGNDTDGDSDKLQIVSVSGANVTYNAVSQTITYNASPLSNNAVNAGTFTYQVSDGNGGLSTGTVSIDTVNGDNVNLLTQYATPASYQASYIDSGNGTDVDDGGPSIDILIGGAGADTLRGGAGSDTLRGGAGNDTIDGQGTGTDIDLIDFSDGTTGAGLNFTLVQSASDTVFDASAAGLGTDTYRNVEGVIGTNLADTLTGSAFNDVLIGGGGDDTINGNAGADRIQGGLGKDTLTGGANADTFVFIAPNEMPIGTGNRDVITDFSQAEGDKIDLSTIDAKTQAGFVGDQPFTFVANATPAIDPGVQANSITWYHDTANNLTIIHGDVDGNTTADFEIQLSGLVTLTADDFHL